MEKASPVEAGDKQQQQHGITTTTAPPSTTTASDHATTAPSTTAPVEQKVQAQNQTDGDDDEDSDFDELDDVLDDFSKPKPSTSTTSTGPGIPDAKPQSSTSSNDFDEDAFMKQLEQEMANMVTHAAGESGTTHNNEDFTAAIDQGADAFAKQLEESGIPPGDFLKQLLADVMAEEGGGTGGASGSSESNSAAAAEQHPPESFNDAIQRTINRMKESGDKATAAAAQDDVSDDLLAQLLKAVEAGAAGAGDDADLTKLFAGMMEQLSNKEMLYEPMKELDAKFPPWIAENKGKVSDEDMARYETQAKVVAQIVAKFEEPGYTDEDQKCREYVWEKMQEMQAAGSPPEELIANPYPDLLGKDNGPVPPPECPQQ